MMLLAATRYDHATTHTSYCCFMQRLVSGANTEATPWMAAQTSTQTHTQSNRALLDQHRLSNKVHVDWWQATYPVILWLRFTEALHRPRYPQHQLSCAGVRSFDASSCSPQMTLISHKQLPWYAGDTATFTPWCSVHVHPNRPASTQASHSATPQPNCCKSSQHCCSCIVHILPSLALVCITPLHVQQNCCASEP